MAEISHLAEAWTRLSWPKMIPFCFHVKAAEVAAEVTSRAAVSTKMVAGRSISARHRVTALQFLLFVFLCTYSTILDLGYVKFLAFEGNCARTSISGVKSSQVLTPQSCKEQGARIKKGGGMPRMIFRSLPVPFVLSEVPDVVLCLCAQGEGAFPRIAP